MDEQQKAILRESGIDVDTAIARFMDKDDMYVKFLGKFITEEKNIDGLQAGIEIEDVDQAFACAHSMKGVSANLGLDAVNEKLIPLVEILRKGELVGAKESLSAVLEQLTRVKKAFLDCHF